MAWEKSAASSQTYPSWRRYSLTFPASSALSSTINTFISITNILSYCQSPPFLIAKFNIYRKVIRRILFIDHLMLHYPKFFLRSKHQKVDLTGRIDHRNGVSLRNAAPLEIPVEARHDF